jgi:hypothetical protein
VDKLVGIKRGGDKGKNRKPKTFLQSIDFKCIEKTKYHIMTRTSQIYDLLEVDFPTASSRALNFLPASMGHPDGAALKLPFHSKPFEQASSYFTPADSRLEKTLRGVYFTRAHATFRATLSS